MNRKNGKIFPGELPGWPGSRKVFLLLAMVIPCCCLLHQSPPWIVFLIPLLALSHIGTFTMPLLWRSGQRCAIPWLRLSAIFGGWMHKRLQISTPFIWSGWVNPSLCLMTLMICLSTEPRVVESRVLPTVTSTGSANVRLLCSIANFYPISLYACPMCIWLHWRRWLIKHRLIQKVVFVCGFTCRFLKSLRFLIVSLPRVGSA